jgi:hypothetical protein
MVWRGLGYLGFRFLLNFFSLFPCFESLNSSCQPGLEDGSGLEDNWKDQSQLGHVVVVYPYVLKRSSREGVLGRDFHKSYVFNSSWNTLLEQYVLHRKCQIFICI